MLPYIQLARTKSHYNTVTFKICITDRICHMNIKPCRVLQHYQDVSHYTCMYAYLLYIDLKRINM